MENTVIRIKDLLFKPYLSAQAIQARLDEIAKKMNETLQNPVFVVVLNGGYAVAADLIKRFEGVCEVGFVKLSSYEGLNSVGSVAHLLKLQTPIADREVVVIEDIIDTGLTMHYFLAELRIQQPKRLLLFTLLFKPEAVLYAIQPDYVGFFIENKFVVGYGLDYCQYGRNLPAIYQLHEEDNSQLSE